jgi:septum formation inhibitor-activating ATPase MinD
VSLIGGTGVTSLAANLALALRYAFDKRVAVIDLDLQTGGLSVFLNLEPERTIMALAEGTRKLDSIQLESALSKHASGIYLLAAPKRIEDSELVSDATVGAILDLMRQLFDFVIVRLRHAYRREHGRRMGALESSVLRARPIDRRGAMRVAIRRPGGTAGAARSRAEFHLEPFHPGASDQ